MGGPRTSSVELHLVTTGDPVPSRPRLIHALGGRADVVRAASLIAALEEEGVFEQVIVHSGDPTETPVALELRADPGIPAPDRWLGVPPGSHGQRTGAMLAGFEAVLDEVEPELAVIYGAGDTAVACGLAAAKLGIALAHVEAGLRHADPGRDDVNRTICDQLADTLLAPTAEAGARLLAEGIPDTRVHVVGDTAVDVLRRHEAGARARATWERRGATEGEYVLVSLHRRRHLAGPVAAEIAHELLALAADVPLVVCLSHVGATSDDARSAAAVLAAGGLAAAPAAEYADHLSLLAGAGAVITDAGGVQDEASALGVSCYTLGSSTDREMTVLRGTNTLLGDDLAALRDVRPAPPLVRHALPAVWDGHAGARIATTLTAHYALV